MCHADLNVTQTYLEVERGELRRVVGLLELGGA